jgi:rSAM/selenodomain-associated transferase 2
MIRQEHKENIQPQARLDDLVVIVPTLNAAAVLPACLAALGQGVAVLVVDGRSSDDTAMIARACGAAVLESDTGRGVQLAAGIAATTQAWLLLLHADTRLGAGWGQEAARFMTERPGNAGYFRFALDSADPRARRLERMVAWRCRLLGLPYGDQGLLIQRDLLRNVGGMRPLPLMEDVDLVRRIGHSRLIALATPAVTSAQRWQAEGWYRRSLRNLTCLLLYGAGVAPGTIQRLYERRPGKP